MTTFGRKARTVAEDNEFLFYPIDTGEDPACLGCGKVMVMAGHEIRQGKPDLISFRCDRCARTEKFISEED